MKSFIHLVRRVCGITAFQFLHTALDGVFGILPVGIFVAVVEFLHKPGYVFGKTGHILFHQREDHIIEFRFLLIIQAAVGAFA